MRTNQQGFTIIEAIVVIVLVGILGAVVVSRFTTPNTFNIQIAQDGIITTLRAAQQAALGRDNISFKIVPGGDNLDLIVEEGSATIRTLTVAGDGVTLETGTTADTGMSCASGYDDDIMPDFEIAFDGLGNAISLLNNSITEQPVDNGVRICINDTDSLSICVSPAGFAHEGDCDA